MKNQCSEGRRERERERARCLSSVIEGERERKRERCLTTLVTITNECVYGAYWVLKLKYNEINEWKQLQEQT